MNESSLQLLSKIDPYLRGKLDETDRSAIEVCMLEDPAFLEEVQRHEALAAGMAENSDLFSTKPHTSVSNQNHNSLNLNFARWIKQPFSIAATAVIAIGIVLNMAGPFNNTPGAMNIIQSSVFLETLRGDDGSQVASGLAPLLITIDVGPAPVGSYSVTIMESATDELISASENIEPSEMGLLRVLVTEDLFGEHLVRISSSEPDATRSYSVTFTN